MRRAQDSRVGIAHLALPVWTSKIMRIQQISVSGLFGIFDHVIPLNMDDQVTIIHGPNGFGKTVILRMIDGFFKSQYSVFRNIPFSKFRVEFDNSSSVEIAKNYNNTENQQNITIYFSEKDSQTVSFSPKSRKFPSNIDFQVEILEDIIPMLLRVSPTKWTYITGENLFLEDVIDRFGDFLAPKITLQKEPEWLNNLKSNIHIRLIESQRLLNLVPSRSLRSDNAIPSSLPTVSAYSNELTEIIQEKFTEYGTISQSLDRSFLVRVVKQQEKLGTDWTDEQLRYQLNELEKTRDRLI